MSADSASVSISVSQTIPNGKTAKAQPSDEDAEAFEISLEVAREQSDGDSSTTNITIQGTTTENDGAEESESGVKIEIEISGDGLAEALGVTENAGTEMLTDVTIEIESVVFSGANLEQNLTATTIFGDGHVAQTDGGSFGVSGSISGEAEVRLEVGETLSFSLPETEGEVVGGQVTITNLFNDGESGEGALVFAYDSDDRLVASYFALGNETGEVTIEINVAFARLDFKAADNGAFFFEDNSNFGVSEVSAIFASVVEGLSEDASQLIDDIINNAGDILAKVIDVRHFGTVNFEITRITADQMATIEGLRRVSVDLDSEIDRERDVDLEQRDTPGDAWRLDVDDRLAG